MAKMRKKSELPTKICQRCGLPFSWRRKWVRDWEAVKYCSERCRKAGGLCGRAVR
ncbi:MAG: DUF2256 domain-containing protein [Sulfitobacter litoralis]|nr:DUF2256 domain-containing protein [Sulfitobacter litoralis]